MEASKVMLDASTASPAVQDARVIKRVPVIVRILRLYGFSIPAGCTEEEYRQLLDREGSPLIPDWFPAELPDFTVPLHFFDSEKPYLVQARPNGQNAKIRYYDLLTEAQQVTMYLLH